MQPHHSSNGNTLVASAGGGFLPDQMSGATRENGTVAQSSLSPRASRESANELQPLQILHRSLRGHYPIVIMLGVLFGLGGAVLGWIVPKPVYRSEGLIQIRYAQPSVDPGMAQSGLTPFDVFMESQKTLITSRRVIDKALEDPTWKSLGLPVTEQTHRNFASKLEVESRHSTEYLKICFNDSDPNIAARAVQAVTSGYSAVYREDEQQLKNIRLKVFTQSRNELTKRITESQAEIEEVVKKFGSADVTSLHDAAVQRTTRLDSAIDDINVALAAVNSPLETSDHVHPSVNQVNTARESSITPEQIARTDDVMRTYLNDQRSCQQRLDQLKLRGYGDAFPEVIFARSTLDKATERVQRYLEECKALQTATGRTPGALETPAFFANRTPAALRAEEAKLAALHVKARLEMVELGEAHVRQVLRDAQLRKDRETLDTINRKIDQLEDQDQMGGRLTVINAGEVPLSPTLDRRLKISGASAAVGFVFPVAMFGLYGLMRRRYRYADETIGDSPAAPLLGIIPSLEGDPDQAGWDFEQATYAAQQVHQVRIMLQTGRQDIESASYLVTSATAGEGKTSLTMALGLSFAATGLRTLVIDSDLVGQQLTRGIEAADYCGLHEALRTGTIEGFLRRVDGGLCVLPVGKARAFDACAISSASFKRLITESRRYFDAILIDSGPILASVEASVLAQEVDGVIFAIARGQQPPLVDRAMRHLNSLGAKVCGLVFNRAKSADFYGSRYASSGSGSSSASKVAGENLPATGRCRLGPLVAAVLSSLPRAQQPVMA